MAKTADFCEKINANVDDINTVIGYLQHYDQDGEVDHYSIIVSDNYTGMGSSGTIFKYFSEIL